jgi:hypothetical protein
VSTTNQQQHEASTVRSGACPYCGGGYSITQTCHGPRTDNPDENTCREAARHRRLVRAALDEEETVNIYHDPNQHPTDEQLGSYIDDTLTMEEHGRIEEHLAACEECVTALADALRFCFRNEQEGDG